MTLVIVCHLNGRTYDKFCTIFAERMAERAKLDELDKPDSESDYFDDDAVKTQEFDPSRQSLFGYDDSSPDIDKSPVKSQSPPASPFQCRTSSDYYDEPPDKNEYLGDSLCKTQSPPSSPLFECGPSKSSPSYEPQFDAHDDDSSPTKLPLFMTMVQQDSDDSCFSYDSDTMYKYCGYPPSQIELKRKRRRFTKHAKKSKNNQSAEPTCEKLETV